MTTKRLAALVASGVLVLGGGVGMAAALDATGQRADHTQDVSKVSHDTTEVENEAAEDEAEHGVENEAAETAGDEAGAQDNHGAEVSAVAQATEPGPDHGKTVSAVASSNSQRGEHEADEATEHAGSNRGAGSANSGRSGGDDDDAEAGHGGHGGDD
jgi:hypothetical protein